MDKRIKNLKKQISRNLSKGHELFTIMVIPHAERRIFTLQVSKYTILYISLVIISIIFAAIIALNKHGDTLKKTKKYKSDNVLFENSLNEFLSISLDIEKSNNSLSQTFDDYHYFGISSFQKMSNSIAESKNSMQSINLMQNSLEAENILELQKLYSLKKRIVKIDKKSMQMIKIVKGFKKYITSIPSIFPIVGEGILTSGFGIRIDPFTLSPSFHTGLDISAFVGTPVRATADGKVTYAEYGADTGNLVMINHKYGFSSGYYHLEKFAVSVGDSVKRGEIIGYVGNTGRSLGYHLHYEVKINGKQTDPFGYIYLDIF